MYQKKTKKKNNTSSICQNMMKFRSETVLIISHFQTLFRFKHGERLPQHFLHGLHHEHIPLLICISQKMMIDEIAEKLILQK